MKEITSTTVRRRYARLPLALALGALVLTPAVIGFNATSAEAAVAGRGETAITVSGDARIRGFWREDADFNDDVDDRNRQLQHRMRMAVDVTAAGGTSLHTRFHMANNDMDTWGTNDTLNVATDYLFFRVPVGDATVTTGRQVINWGHRMKAWDARADRLRVDYKVNDEVTIFGYYQKDVESQVGALTTDRAKDRDRNRYSIGAIYNTKDLRIGGQLRQIDDRRTGASPSGDDGQELYGFATIKSGDLTTSIEADFGFGNARRTAEGRTHAMFLGFDYAMGDTNLNLNGVWADNGYRSLGGGHFDQVSMFYNTAGGHGLGRELMGTSSTDREYGISIGAVHKLSPELSLGGKLAYIDGKNAAANWDVTALEASMAYRINASTTYHIDGLYAKADGRGANDAYWGLSHRFEIRF